MNQTANTIIIAATAAIVTGTITFMVTHPPKGQEAQAATVAAPLPEPTEAAKPEEVIEEAEPVRDAGSGDAVAEAGSGEVNVHDEAYATKAQTRQAVLNLLNDPRSAQFRRVGYTKFENGAAVICGEVNAKNGFGGYGDYLPFYGAGDWATIYDGSPSWEIGFRRQCVDKPIEGVFSDF